MAPKSKRCKVFPMNKTAPAVKKNKLKEPDDELLVADSAAFLSGATQMTRLVELSRTSWLGSLLRKDLSAGGYGTITPKSSK